MQYDLSTTHNGMILAIKGYSEKASELLTTVLAELKETRPSLEEFQLYKTTLQREYGNRAKASPMAQGFDLLWSALYKEFTPVAEKEEIIRLISYDDFMLFSNQIWKVCYIEGTFYGNLSEKEAIALFDQIDKELEGRHPYPLTLHPKVMLATLPSGKDPVYLAKKSSLPGNVVILTLDCGRFSFDRQAALQILTKGLEEPFFSELRTKQQTGYLVANLSKEVERHLYSFFLVQSSTHDTRDLLARFELFLETSLQQEHLITEERFESIRASLINSLENPAENMPKMGNLYHTLAFEYDGEFGWLEKRIAGLKELSYAEFQDFARKFLSKENKKRLAVCINGALPKKGRFRYRHVAKPQTLRKELTYQDRSA